MKLDSEQNEIGMRGFGLSCRRRMSRTTQDAQWVNRRFNLENDFVQNKIGMRGFGLSCRRGMSRTTQDAQWVNRRFNLETDFVQNKIGMTGFEPATPATRTRCATKLRYIPIMLFIKLLSYKIILNLK